MADEQMQPTESVRSGALLPPFPPDKLVGVFADMARGQIQYFSTDCLINRIGRDSVSYAESFDRICGADLAELSRLFSVGFCIVAVGIQTSKEHKDELRLTCGIVLLNAENTLAAGAELVRRGYRLQPGILLRNVVESACSVLHLCQRPSDLTSFEAGDLDSSRTVGLAKRLLPDLGCLYGLFSEEFAHVGVLHREIQPAGPYKERDLALSLNMYFLYLAAWLIHTTAELLFLDHVAHPVYWRHEDPDTVRYDPDPQTRQWLDKLLSLGQTMVSTGS